MPTIVSAPGDLVVATVDGIDVRFGAMNIGELPPGLEQYGQGLTVRLYGARGPETMRRDNVFMKALYAWAETRHDSGSETRDPPAQMPGAAVLGRVQAQITDDVGTGYRWVGSRTAGTGTDWEGSWSFIPEPPPGAAVLVLAFTLDGTPTGRDIRMRLSEG